MLFRHQKGFTLLEVLVALAVVAIGLAAVIKATGGHTANISYLKNKTLASWVAANRATEMQLQGWPEIGTSKGSSLMANQEWYWEAKVTATPDADVRRIDISVKLTDDRQLSQLVAFASRPIQ